jgi:hypothetical protein
MNREREKEREPERERSSNVGRHSFLKAHSAARSLFKNFTFHIIYSLLTVKGRETIIHDNACVDEFMLFDTLLKFLQSLSGHFSQQFERKGVNFENFYLLQLQFVRSPVCAQHCVVGTCGVFELLHDAIVFFGSV